MQRKTERGHQKLTHTTAASDAAIVEAYPFDAESRWGAKTDGLLARNIGGPLAAAVPRRT